MGISPEKTHPFFGGTRKSMATSRWFSLPPFFHQRSRPEEPKPVAEASTDGFRLTAAEAGDWRVRDFWSPMEVLEEGFITD